MEEEEEEEEGVYWYANSLPFNHFLFQLPFLGLLPAIHYIHSPSFHLSESLLQVPISSIHSTSCSHPHYSFHPHSPQLPTQACGLLSFSFSAPCLHAPNFHNLPKNLHPPKKRSNQHLKIEQSKICGAEPNRKEKESHLWSFFLLLLGFLVLVLILLSLFRVGSLGASIVCWRSKYVRTDGRTWRC